MHDLIPGGCHTYSKGDDQFPALSPAAISRGKGAYLWDIDGNRYLDCSMGLTSVSLGHAYEPVLDRVRKELEKGVNFQRPSSIEAEMAERFLSLLPHHDMIKFSKNGSTATTAAVKLARASTGRKYVAVPGDHPFYSYDDWFIATTACPLGVPEETATLSLTYTSTDRGSLESLFQQYPDQIACVITEPEKNTDVDHFGSREAAVEHLTGLIELTHSHGALFIADEMVTGFKTGLPGSMGTFQLNADLATWGKGIANGFSFCALTGKREVMELGGIRNQGSEKVFLISTTHGGETHAIAAGLATLEEFQRKDVLDHLHHIGRYFCTTVEEVIRSKNLAKFVTLTPAEWLPMLAFKNSEKRACQGMRTLLMQEMIARGVLFQGVLVPSFSHCTEDIDRFCEAFSESLEIYRKALESGYQEYLVGEPCRPVFRKFL